MPRTGMKKLRRKALIDAAILTIGEHGSLGVTMSEIAGRAGVSPALAHHYFGAKEDLLQATMRQLLADLGQRLDQGARRRRDAARARFGGHIGEFLGRAVSPGNRWHAWLAFYVEAQKSMLLRRLLRVYARRLHSNLMSGLGPLMARPDAERASEAIAALIDGLYIRRALRDGLPNPASAAALVEDYVTAKLGAAA